MYGVVDKIATDHLTKVRIKDRFIAAVCPFHKGGQERHPSFWLDRLTGRWGCFTCGLGKNRSLRDLLKELGVRSRKIEAEIEEAEKDAERIIKSEEIKRKKKAKSDFKGTHLLPEAILGVFDWAPVDLLEQGFTEEVLQKNKIGFDQRNNRITFPIRDIYGNLMGISGRATIPGDHPKYLFYRGRTVGDDGKEQLNELGEWYPDYSNEDVKSHLWGAHFFYNEMMASNDGQLIIVEGYKARLWLAQHGWTQTVATMGVHMTASQERLIRRLGVPTWVFMDNNEPGLKAAHKICQRLAVSTFPVYRVWYPEEAEEDIQPDDLSEQGLETALSTATRYGGRFYDRSKRMANHKTAGQKVKQRKVR